MNFFVETLLIFSGIVCMAATGCIAAILGETKTANTPVKDLIVGVIIALVSAFFFVCCIYSGIDLQNLSAADICALVCPALPFCISIAAIVRVFKKKRMK